MFKYYYLNLIVTIKIIKTMKFVLITLFFENLLLHNIYANIILYLHYIRTYTKTDSFK